MRPVKLRAALTALAVVLMCAPLVGCAALSGSTAEGPSQGSTPREVPEYKLPAPDMMFDYQLGGADRPGRGVEIVVRDRTAAPANAGYDICYINGFQTQPDDSVNFAHEHPDLVVHMNGAPLADPDWPNEFIFDTSTALKRATLGEIVGHWITGCKAAGYEAVEIDNVDSYTRSRSALTAADNTAMAAIYARLAHEAGLAIAQKNAAELTDDLARAGYDFAITESCMVFHECATYERAYDVLLDVEYTDEIGKARFDAACADPERPRSMILRDHDLAPASDPAHYFATCREAAPTVASADY